MNPYHDPKTGRFTTASGGTGYFSNKIKSVKAHDTKVAGKMAQLEAKTRAAGGKRSAKDPLMPTPRLPFGDSGLTKAQKRRRIQRIYKDDPQGLKSDIRATRRRTRPKWNSKTRTFSYVRQDLDSLWEPM